MLVSLQFLYNKHRAQTNTGCFPESHMLFSKKSSGHLRSEGQVNSTCRASSKWHKMRLYDDPILIAC